MRFRGGMNELMRQASRLQRKIENRRKELEGEEFEAGAVNDKIMVKVNGAREVVSINIDKTILEEDDGFELLQDSIVAAVNAAMTKSREHVDAELEKVSGGLKIPGIS